MRSPSPSHPVTPDGRYFVVRGRLWRVSDPSLSDTSLSDEARQDFVNALMAARRRVRDALRAADANALRNARAAVDSAKHGLGERGPVWWDDGAPDYNRNMARNTQYADWWHSVRDPEDKP